MCRLDSDGELGMRAYAGRREAITAERWHTYYKCTKRKAEELAKENQTEPRVYVQEVENGQVLWEYELPHYSYHSPNGFEWGYGGSGPADLARCILIHFLCLGPKRSCRMKKEVMVPHYQDFKSRFLAIAPEEGFLIDEEQIGTWAKEQGILLPPPRPLGRLRNSLLAD